jgi:hypothetical protein
MWDRDGEMRRRGIIIYVGTAYKYTHTTLHSKLQCTRDTIIM